MSSVPPPAAANEMLETVARLSTAQQAMLSYLANFTRPITIAEIAERQNLHHNSVRESIDSLYAAGLVSRKKIDSPGRGRPSWGYFSIAPQNDVVNGAYISRFMKAVSEMISTWDDPQEKAYALGAAWGSTMRGLIHKEINYRVDTGQEYSKLTRTQRMAVVRSLLSAAGHAAVIKEGTENILQMHACPFLDTDGTINPLICEVHRGQLVQLIEDMSEESENAALFPCIRSGICEVHLHENSSAE